ncbi:hypothetical protein D3C75_1206400 [compost metagenome]
MVHDCQACALREKFNAQRFSVMRTFVEFDGGRVVVVDRVARVVNLVLEQLGFVVVGAWRIP